MTMKEAIRDGLVLAAAIALGVYFAKVFEALTVAAIKALAS
jgi:hypothetical protein